MRPQKDRLLAELLFVGDGKSYRHIAARLGASNKTIWRWACAGKWMERRRQRRLDSPMASLELLKRERDRLIQTFAAKPSANGESPADPATLETLNKINRTIEKMEPQMTSVDAMLDVFARFAEFIATHADAGACAVIREWTEKFLDDERRRSS
jgi:transposase